jgi:hypothetical protein
MLSTVAMNFFLSLSGAHPKVTVCGDQLGQSEGGLFDLEIGDNSYFLTFAYTASWSFLTGGGCLVSQHILPYF